MAIEVGGGGGGLPQLAPNIGEFALRQVAASAYRQILNIDVSGGTLQSILSLTGKFRLDFISLSGIPTVENLKLKLTIDGEVIYDEDWMPQGNQVSVIGFSTNPTTSSVGCYQVNESLLLEVATIADNNIGLQYIVTPIL